MGTLQIVELVLHIAAADFRDWVEALWSEETFSERVFLWIIVRVDFNTQSDQLDSLMQTNTNVLRQRLNEVFPSLPLPTSASANLW